MRLPSAPVRVLDLNLHVGRPLADVDRLSRYHGILGVVRIGGRPVGYLEHPTSADSLSGRLLTDRALTAHHDALLLRVLTDALIDGTFARAAGPADLLGARVPASRDRLPSLTVAVCSRDRADDLTRCLEALQASDYPGLDILVVDNAPRDGATCELVQHRHPGVRYVREPCPGLNWARRRAVGESASEVIAYVDDDVVVEPTWARTIAAVMAANPDVAAVTGLVVPLELETEAQVLFERHGGFGRRFVRRWIRRPDGEHAARLFANTATFGTGANMAFRRNALLEIGLFDPALDAGTPSEAGGDLDVFFRVLAAGHTLVYEPAATVRHRHRRSMIEVESQMRGWPLGMLAYLARSEQAYPGDRAVFGTLANRLLFVHYPRRVAQSLFDASLRPSLTLAELRGAALGRRRFRVAREQATRLAAEFGYDLSGVVRDTAPIPPRRLAPVRGVRIDLSDPLPVVLPGSDDSDRVRVEVSRAGVGIGSVVLVTGGYSIGRERLADAIAAELGKRLLGPASVWRLALREAFSTA